MTNNIDLSGVTWRKSSYSNGDGGDCVEVATIGAEPVGVRDSKSLGGPVLTFTAQAWRSFVTDVRCPSED